MGYKLKPCPFCGGQAELDTLQSFRAFVSGKIETAVAVYCTACSAEISVCVSDVPDIQPEQLVDMWNTQSPVEDLSALVQRLVRRLRKAAPDDELPDLAMDYLRRTNRLGSPLRSEV